MSVDPQMMGQMLMNRGQQPGMAGIGGQPAPSGGPNLLQQILAMQQLKQRLGQLPQQPPQAGPMAPQNTPMGPGTNA